LVYLWRAVDAEGEVLDVLVQAKRNRHAALRLMRKLLKKYGFVPEKLITDDLRSPQPVIWGSRTAMNAVGGETIELRTHISRPDEENARCNVSRDRAQPSDFSRPMQLSTTPSTSNATSHQPPRTEAFAPRR